MRSTPCSSTFSLRSHGMLLSLSLAWQPLYSTVLTTLWLYRLQTFLTMWALTSHPCHGSARLSFTVALPFDMTKTIIQATKARQGETVPGVVETMTRLFREGGLGRLYTGWPVALGRGVPGAAIMLATHTHVSQAVDEHWARTDQRGRDPVPRAKAIGVVVPPSGKLRTKLTK